MTDPFAFVFGIAIGWVACHLVGSLVHELRVRAPGARAALPRSARRPRVGRGLI